MGRCNAADVHAALCALGETPQEPPPTAPAEKQHRLDELVRIERMHSVSEMLLTLGQEVRE